MKNDVCEITIVDSRKVEQIKERLVDRKTAKKLANIFRAMSDPSRIKIFNALFDQELCVCDLAEVIGLSQSATSHQLRLLKDMDLVKYIKRGKSVFYSLADQHVEILFKVTLKHLKHGKTKT